MSAARHSILLLAAALLASVGCSRAPSVPPFYRFVDHVAGAAQKLDIGGTEMRVLDPGVAEHVFPLADAPPKGRLCFSLGLTLPAPYRFEILLDADGAAAVSLYVKEVRTPGWTSDEVPLTVRDPGHARLVFRTTPVGGGAQQARAAWGNPLLLTGTTGRAPSVVLISLDTVRADRVGTYGRPGANTPALDAFARAGTVYENVYSPSTWTFPSHQSLLTGVYPRATNGRDPAVVPLARILRQAGYLTAGFTGGGWLSHTLAFDDGFDTYFDFHATGRGDAADLSRFDGPTVFGQGGDWAVQHASAPFFLFLHTYDAHDRVPFLDGLTDPVEIQRRADAFPPARQQALMEYYGKLVTGVDALVGRLLAQLDQAGLAARTLVIVGSDHGEALWEHGFEGHGCLKPYEELARIPLLLRWPGRVPASARVTQPVSQVSVAATILALAGLEVPVWMQGSPLPGLGVPAPPADKPIFVQCDDWLVVRAGASKLITYKDHQNREELYDLAADPDERASIMITAPAVRDALRTVADGYWRALAGGNAARPPLEQLDQPTRDRLRALGYVE